MERKSDRWMTPGVLCVLVLAGTVVVLAVLAAVTYLTARGFDPQPIVQLTGTLVGAAAALGTFVQNTLTRRTTAKVERETGRLATGVVQVVDQLEAERGRHAYPPGGVPDVDDVDDDQLEFPIDPETRPHPLYGHGPARGAAPGREGR
jgi:hypothetical protein